MYTALGINDTERQATYRRLFNSYVEGEWLKNIIVVIKSGMALGHDRFKNELTSLRARRLNSLPPGRKLRWRKSSYNFVLTTIVPIKRYRMNKLMHDMKQFTLSSSELNLSETKAKGLYGCCGSLDTDNTFYPTSLVVNYRKPFVLAHQSHHE